MSKHTPGPWTYERSKGWGGDICITQESGKRPFLKAIKPTEYYTDFPDGKSPGSKFLSTELAKEQGRYVATDEIRKELDAVEIANARLIAMAPELLAALLDVQKRIKEGDEWWIDIKERGGFDIQTIDAVIAKATGEQS